jgi:hypothetical protein
MGNVESNVESHGAEKTETDITNALKKIDLPSALHLSLNSGAYTVLLLHTGYVFSHNETHKVYFYPSAPHKLTYYLVHEPRDPVNTAKICVIQNSFIYVCYVDSTPLEAYRLPKLTCLLNVFLSKNYLLILFEQDNTTHLSLHKRRWMKTHLKTQRINNAGNKKLEHASYYMVDPNIVATLDPNVIHKHFECCIASLRVEEEGLRSVLHYLSPDRIRSRLILEV